MNINLVLNKISFKNRSPLLNINNEKKKLICLLKINSKLIFHGFNEKKTLNQKVYIE